MSRDRESRHISQDQEQDGESQSVSQDREQGREDRPKMGTGSRDGRREADVAKAASREAETPATLQELLLRGSSILQEHGIADAKNDAWLLLEFVTSVRRAQFLADRMRAVGKEERTRYLELVYRRACHIPLQHLTGEQEFMGLTFQVSRHVLVPRQDTETLVEEALACLRPGMRVLDLCTGSGCIALSLGHYCSGLQIDAADISGEALAVARQNGRTLEIPVRWIQSDLFAQLPFRYDVIVSNPPYIRTAVIAELEEEVRLHEPLQALDGKEDGLFFYRAIIREAGLHLNGGGWLLFETGYDQAKEVSGLLWEAGFTQVRTVKDLSGKNRVAAGCWPGVQ